MMGLFLFCSSIFAMTSSTYNPSSVDGFDKNKLNYNGQKVSAVVPGGTTQDIDLALTDDHLLTGAQVVLSGNCDLDEIKFKVVMGTTVVNQFIDWFATNFSKDLPYPAKIPAGLTLRVTYKNSCTNAAVTVRVNYFLHKILL